MTTKSKTFSTAATWTLDPFSVSQISSFTKNWVVNTLRIRANTNLIIKESKCIHKWGQLSYAPQSLSRPVRKSPKGEAAIAWLFSEISHTDMTIALKVNLI